MILPISQKAQAEIIGKIEAHVGNKIITSYDVENLDPAAYKQILAIPDKDTRNRQLEQFKSQALDFLINQLVVETAGERAGIKVSDTEIDRAIDEIAANNKVSKAQLSELLKKEGLSMEKYRYQIKNQILNAKIRNQVLMPKIVVTDTDIRKMADKKADELRLKDRYDLRIITVQTKGEIKEVLKEIKNGMPFEEAAKKYSLDTSASDGGKLGWIDVTYVPAEMANALKGLKTGDMTKPFRNDSQWAVCLVEDFTDKYSFDNETREILTDAAGNEIFDNVFRQWLARNQETIVILKSGGRFEVK